MADGDRAADRYYGSARDGPARGRRQARLRAGNEGDPEQRRQRRAGVDRRPEKPGALVCHRHSGRMIFTARQIEDLHKTNGHVTLPVGARLTPMASDWARSRKVAIVYDGQVVSKDRAAEGVPAAMSQQTSG